MPPEARYQALKEAWYFYNSGRYMRHANGYDGYGDNKSMEIFSKT